MNKFLIKYIIEIQVNENLMRKYVMINNIRLK